MIPEGMRDILSPETVELRALEGTLCARFQAYGYEEVRTPSLEHVDTFEAVEDDTLSAGYRLYDEQGSELMLRTDMTVPVARLAAARFRERPLPLRLFYVAPSVRPWAPQRSQDGEFEQAGAELLGLRSAAADAECVTLLCDCLHTLGLDEVRVALGNVAFYEALIASLGLEQDDRAALLEALADRDYPLVESIAGKAHLGDEGRRALQRALELAGTRDAVAQARKLATTPAVDQAIDHMVEVRDLVAEAGFEDVIVFDFALFQDLGYYTGLTFEAYAPGLGLPVASGGRYDGLLARFDWDQPAVGFAIGLDRVHAALEETSLLPSAGAPLLSFAGGLSEPARAAELRRLGWRVEALPDDAVVRPPCLRRDGGRYRLELAGAETAGGWRDVLRALEQS